MLLPTEIVTVVASVLVALVTSISVFAHRFSDKCSKLDEKQCTDELNEIRFAIRSKNTTGAVYKIWRFLSDLEKKLAEKDLMESYVNSLLYNTEHREKFNALISEVEDTLKESRKIKDAYDALKQNYGKLSKTLYTFALVVGLTCFPLLGLSAPSVTLIPSSQLEVIWLLVIIMGILFLVPVLYFNVQVNVANKIYSEKKNQFHDEVKVVK